MKKMIALAAVLSAVAFAACSDSEPTTETTPEAAAVVETPSTLPTEEGAPETLPTEEAPATDPNAPTGR